MKLISLEFEVVHILRNQPRGFKMLTIDYGGGLLVDNAINFFD